MSKIYTVTKKGKEYDCGEIEITTEQWYALLKEPKAKQYIDVLIAFLREPEHKGSCYSVARKHNNDPQSYNAKVMHFGKWVHSLLGNFTIYGTDGKQTYWAISMRYGWETKDGFVWKLRKELVRALQRILLNNIFAEFKHLHETDSSYVHGEIYKWELLQNTNEQNNIEIVRLLKGKNIVDNPRVDSVLKYLYEEKTSDLNKCVSDLLNESISLDKRLSVFKDTMRNICPQTWKNCANDERTASAILTCKYPLKYTFYKNEIYLNVCHYLGIETKKSGMIYSHFMDIINKITDIYGEKVQKIIAKEISPYPIKPQNLAIQTVFWILKDQIKNYSNQEIEMTINKHQKYIDLLKANHNIIFNGAPGTGKTHLAKEIAEEMNATVKMVQFHPSYDYTDFVEGLRPIKDEKGNIGFERKDGVFKEFCRKALIASETSSNEDLFNDLNDNPTVWKVSLGGTGDNPIRTDCLEKGWIRIGWNSYGDVEDFNDFEDFKDGGKVILRAFQQTMQIGDIVLSCYSEKEIDAIGIVVGDYEYHGDVSDFQRYRKVKWLVKGIQEDIRRLNRNKVMTLSTIYKLPIKVKDIVDIVNRHIQTSTVHSNNNKKEPPFVFIIDEINRGEISKIFGELFYSIDPGYRGEDGNVQTQYQNLVEDGDVFKEGFYVPENVYIIGTMNDIDRSVESMDFAMCRRFAWQEITAEESADNMGITGELRERMDCLNKVIEKTEGLGSAYQVGAAMFLKVKDTGENADGNCGMTVERLWNLNLKSLMKEYLRGLPEADSILQEMEDAYFLRNKEAVSKDSEKEKEKVKEQGEA